MFILTVLFFFSAASTAVYGQSAIGCHCFTDRSFNPADRFAADDYILATSFNSLLAKFFSVPKRDIVKYKMKQGVDGEDLLVGLKIARATGVDLEQLLGQRRQGRSWSAVLKESGNGKGVRRDPVLAAILSPDSGEMAGAAVADELLSGFFSVGEGQIHDLRMKGLNEKELALVFLLAHVSGWAPERVAAQKTAAGKSWAEIAHGFGVEPEKAGELIFSFPTGS